MEVPVPGRRVRVGGRSAADVVGDAVDEVEVAARELAAGRAEQDQHVARLREHRGDALVGVWDVGDRGHDEGGWHGVTLAVGTGVLVVQRILA